MRPDFKRPADRDQFFRKPERRLSAADREARRAPRQFQADPAPAPTPARLPARVIAHAELQHRIRFPKYYGMTNEQANQILANYGAELSAHEAVVAARKR